MKTGLSGYLDRRRNSAEAARAHQAPPATGFRNAGDPAPTGNPKGAEGLLRGDSPWVRTDGQAFGWLDDLAARGDEASGRLAERLATDWLRHFGEGQDWTPEATGRRLIRWIGHHEFLHPRGAPPEVLANLAAQTAYLSQRWQTEDAGLPRIAALCGLIVANLSLEGLNTRMGAEAVALADLAVLPSDRNPEALLDLLCLLLAAGKALDRTGIVPPKGHAETLVQIVTVLRSLRHADGSLARFHGGGAGAEGRLDLALAEARVRSRAEPLAMGFARLAAGPASVIVDAGDPPDTLLAQASTLAVEITVDRQPLVVSAGPGQVLGADWARACRLTEAHSTLCIDGAQSSHAGKHGTFDAPAHVRWDSRAETDEGTGIEAAHDGFSQSHGLSHIRTVTLSHDGQVIVGEDVLTPATPFEQRRFPKRRGAAFAVRFLLHPDVKPAPEGSTLRLTLPKGEVWHFTADAPFELAPAAHVDEAAGEAWQTQMIVLRGTAGEIRNRIGWTFAKARGNPSADPRPLP